MAAWRWVWGISLIVAGAALAALVGLGLETWLETEVWNEERLLTVSSVATMGALLIAAVGIVFQVAFGWGRTWEELGQHREKLKEHGQDIDLLRELYEENREELKDRDGQELLQEFWDEQSQVRAAIAEPEFREKLREFLKQMEGEE